MTHQIYLDHAATTPLAPEVLEVMLPYLKNEYYNPSATYLAAKKINQDVEAARATVAHWLGARPSEIIFTAGGTEANNIAIHGVMQHYPEANVVTSTVEHDAVLQPTEQYPYKRAPVLDDGRVDLPRLEQLINDQTVLVSIMYASNEIGTIQPLKPVSELISAVRKQRRKAGNELPLLFHTDACQAGAYLDLHVARLGVDLMSINASKLYGPKQCGALYVKGGTVLEPFIRGGGQERNLRSGTENVAGIIGFAKALDMAQTLRHEESERLKQLQKQLVNSLSKVDESCVINGSRKHRLPNNVHVTFPGQDNERLMMELDEHGILAAAGSACSASSDKPSHVLQAIGLSDADARASLRFTMGRATTAPDIERLGQVLSQILARK